MLRAMTPRFPRRNHLQCRPGSRFSSMAERLESSSGWVSSSVLLQLAKIHGVHLPSGMALPDVPARVRDVPGAVRAVRTIEPRLLPALELLMVRQAPLPTEHARAVDAGELPDEHPRGVGPGDRRGEPVSLQNEILRGHAAVQAVAQPFFGCRSVRTLGVPAELGSSNDEV